MSKNKNKKKFRINSTAKRKSYELAISASTNSSKKEQLLVKAPCVLFKGAADQYTGALTDLSLNTGVATPAFKKISDKDVLSDKVFGRMFILETVEHYFDIPTNNFNQNFEANLPCLAEEKTIDFLPEISILPNKRSKYNKIITFKKKKSYSTSSINKEQILSDAYVSHMKDGFIFVANIGDKNFSVQKTVGILSKVTGRLVLANVIDFNEYYARLFAFEGNTDVNVFDKVFALSDLSDIEFDSKQTESLEVITKFLISVRALAPLSMVTTASVRYALLNKDALGVDFKSNINVDGDNCSTVETYVNYVDCWSEIFGSFFKDEYFNTLISDLLKLNTKFKKNSNNWVSSTYLNNVDLEESLCIRVSTSMLGCVITGTGNTLISNTLSSNVLDSNKEINNFRVSSDLTNANLKLADLGSISTQVYDYFKNVYCSKIDSKTLELTQELLNSRNITKYFYKTFRNSEVKAPTVMNRKKVIDPLLTGVTLVDVLFPIGKGQRQLIIGDRQTGKTTIAIDTIINQSKRSAFRGLFGFSPTVSIYVSIGQRQSKVYSILNSLKKNNALDSTIIVTSPSNTPCSYQFLAAYTGTTIAEYFRDSGKNVVIVYDDLSKHAVAYRQLSLLLRRSPSRESYPSDIFYVHARLLERSAFLRSGGSLTALPVVETLSNDVSAFIPTNVISITDGQLFLESSLFLKGNKPAIGIGFSVSRIGASAQNSIFKALAPMVRTQLAKYRSLEALKSFSDDLDVYTVRAIQRGERIWDVMKQAPKAPYDMVCQSIFSYCSVFGLLDSLTKVQISNFKAALVCDISYGFLDFKTYVSLNGELLNKTVTSTKLKLYTNAILACLKITKNNSNSFTSKSKNSLFGMGSLGSIETTTKYSLFY